MQWVPSEKKEQPEQESKLKRFVWFKTANGWRKEVFEKTLVKKVSLDTTPPEPHVWFDFSNCDRYSSKEEFEKTLVPLDATPPRKEWVGLTEEEPVANGIIRTLISIDKDGIETWKHEPFYTSPPQREWVGLTEEERESFWRADQMTHKEWDELFAAIEAKLREKNA